MVVKPADRRPLGRTGLQVSPICIGTSPLASMPAQYGYEVSEDRAEATIVAALRSPFNFIDTSNNYGDGAAERYIGRVLAASGGQPPEFVIATKVDPDAITGDFSGDRVKRSVTESLERLGFDRVQLMYLHDPDLHIPFAEAMAPGGAVDALLALRDEGTLGRLGVATGAVGELRKYIATDHFDVALCHNRFTLLDRSAEPAMEDARERGMAFVNAAPYGGGMLAKGPDAQHRYAYESAGQATREAAGAMQRACAAYGVPLAAAALQFSLNDPRVTSTVVGASQPSRINDLTTLMSVPIPADLWGELDSLSLDPALWLN